MHPTQGATNSKTRKLTGFAGFLLSDAIQLKLAKHALIIHADSIWIPWQFQT